MFYNRGIIASLNTNWGLFWGVGYCIILIYNIILKKYPPLNSIFYDLYHTFERNFLSMNLIKIIFSALLLFFCYTAKAQYTFSASPIGVPGYTSITGISGTTTVTTSGNDEYSWNVNIGFDFVFNNRTYTNLNINTNGHLNLTSPYDKYNSNGNNNYIGKFTSLSSDDVIAPLWTDVNGGTPGTILYSTSGVLPNRVFTVEWLGYGIYHGNGNVNFKVELFESSNNIKFSYGSLTGSIQSDDGYIASGLGFKTGTYLALTDLSTNPSLSSITPMTINKETRPGVFNQSDVVPYSSGYYYLFSTPPSISISTPTGTLTSYKSGLFAKTSASKSTVPPLKSAFTRFPMKVTEVNLLSLNANEHTRQTLSGITTEVIWLCWNAYGIISRAEFGSVIEVNLLLANARSPI